MTETQQPASEPAQGARRYPRTFGGLIGSMVVCVAGVLLYVTLQNGTNDRPEIQPEAIDYLDTVATIQDGGYTIAYPPALAEGDIATAVRFTPDKDPIWGLSVFTEGEKFIGIQQEDIALSDLLTTYVDKKAKQGDDVTLGGPLGLTWTTWSDKGGDTAFATEVNQIPVLVFGSAPQAEVRAMAESLTTELVTR